MEKHCKVRLFVVLYNSNFITKKFKSKKIQKIKIKNKEGERKNKN